jgi:glyoxylase-like metal-dependent hydrolase (beta-lactamase superfamily II)
MRLWLMVFAAAAAAAQVRITTGPVNFIEVGEGAGRAVLVTHVRRDVLPAPNAASLIVPEAEADLAAKPEEFWSAFRTGRFHDYAQRSTKVPERAHRIARTVKPGERLQFGGTEVDVLATPGFTAGAVSYLWMDGGKRHAATGDLIYRGGRIIDLYSLQDAIPETKTRGYHGFASRAGKLIESLKAVKAAKPDVLVPSRGPLIDKPAEEIDLLIGRLQQLLDSHFTTDALRWYWGEESWRTRGKITIGRQPSAPMPMAKERDLPEWVIAIGNSRLMVSASGAAFLMDAGYPKIVEALRDLQKQGRFKQLEGLWITHYHDDHTDHAARVAKEFGAKVYFNERIKDILANPGNYRMPCLTTNPVTGEAVGEGASWQWREFKLTGYYFPGQTLYHGGLAVEREGGGKLFFAGDSFTPSGIDDYCLQNRNLVHRNQGYDSALDLLERLGGDYWVINQHVPPVFRFEAEHYSRMRAELAKRRELLAALTPLPDANYAVDEQWARFYPYSVTARGGEAVELELQVENHMPTPQEFRVKWNAPEGWRVVEGQRQVKAGPNQKGVLKVRLISEDGAPAGILTADIAFSGFELRRWSEAMLEVANR